MKVSRQLSRFIVPLLAAAFASSAPAAAATLSVDPPHTSASFSVKHLALTTVSGSILPTSVTIVLAQGDAPASVEATFDLSTIDTREPDRDADLKSDHWFEIAKFPTMTFKSTHISTPDAGGAFTIEGDLAFHGVSKPVSLAAKIDGEIKDSKGRTHVGYSATATVDRRDWNLGLSYPPLVVGDDVTINIQLEAIKT
jgi:polyisoprenoid-binding protein YceI